MAKKAPRRTAERIAAVTLELFNRFGEPNVSAPVIAGSLGMSPGNLHYHFRAKEDLVNALFDRYAATLRELLQAGGEVRDVEEAWFFLHTLFERLWAARFLYRDINDLLSRNRKLETDFRLEAAAASEFADNIANDPEMRAPHVDWDRTVKEVLTLEWIEGIPSLSSQTEADKAANYAERFGNLENRAEEARTIEKKPVLDQGRSIDGKWKPVISKASETKVKLKKLIEPYLIAELKRQKELGLDAEPPRAGTMGRRIGLRSRMIIKVTSPSDLQTHYKADPRLWADKAISEAITKLAEIDLAANKPIPGATLIEELTAN